jgi:hypothetical protein
MASAATPATPAAITAQTHHAECFESESAGAGVSLMRVLLGVSTIEEGRAGAGSFASARRAGADGDSARATLAIAPEMNRKTGRINDKNFNLRNLMLAS